MVNIAQVALFCSCNMLSALDQYFWHSSARIASSNKSQQNWSKTMMC